MVLHRFQEQHNKRVFFQEKNLEEVEGKVVGVFEGRDSWQYGSLNSFLPLQDPVRLSGPWSFAEKGENSD